MVFRCMTPDDDDFPMVQDTARGLGVRVPGDIEPGSDGKVRPGAGGMSVAPLGILHLPCHRRPKAMGHGSTGHDADFVFELDPDDLSPLPLTLREDSKTHALVEPDAVTSLGTFRGALAQTRNDWRIAWPHPS